MSDTVQCLRCTKFSLQDVSKEWLAQGFGNCAHREKFVVFGARRDRDCEKFDEADGDTTAKRLTWLQEKKL